MKRLLKESIERIGTYQPGKPLEELQREYGITEAIKLASNENPLGPSPKAVEAVRTTLEKINRYPDTHGYYLKEKPSGPVTIEIADATGALRTTYTVKDAQAGVSRLVWDMRFDPSPEQMQQSMTQMRNLMDRILQRPEVEESAKEIVNEALEELNQEGLSYREAQAIQQRAFEAIGFGGGMMRFRGGGPGAAVAETGVYSVKLTVNGKSFAGTVSVRQDPIQEDGGN